jgi:hypothetical protein
MSSRGACADTIETVLGALTRTKATADVVTQIRQPVLDQIEKALARVLAKRNAAEKKKAAPKEDEAAKEPAKTT